MGTPLQYAAAGYDFALISQNAGASTASGTLKTDILQYENDDFKQSFMPSIEMSSTAVNTGRLVGKNASLSGISSQLYTQNQDSMNTYTRAKDTYTRQGEINEWQAQNKLDTLFFLQILFLFFSVMVILLYLRQGKVLSATSVYSAIGFFLLVVIAVLWNRVSYTNISRDTRYWNRRHITANPNALSSSNQCS